MTLVQKLPEVPFEKGMSSQLRSFLIEVRKSVEQLRGSSASAPPGLPSNLSVTPQAFANQVNWSRGTGADYHEVLWNTVPTVINSHVVPVQNAAQWSHNVGQSGVTYFYWVRAVKQVALHAVTRTIEVGPIKATTLASGTGVAPPTPPPSGVHQALNPRTGGREAL
jgi:hypothetical protein